ncbi:BspA family leucine-rich repeat surface protein [Flammeovirga aprica]|uniref:BspA family leucine-rich repeat surface protein n=1 Tax=Flammeovirga aprica JL-4 TaxID=694437 RepID=A0A7X9RYC0_9BACT|nr:BspA family leucine-rich repeat surface protein [Flammeovirga aprica]NME70897.1 BspA family leucine-rich repeat surface protein [Flammeovirga aprica JL-4]
MRHLFIYLLFLLPKFLLAQENSSEFIIVVQQDQSPITFSANTQSSFEIDWHNDGNWETITTAGLEEISHEFEGVLDTLRIRGELNHFKAPKNIIDVVQWGDVHFTSMEYAFHHCLLLESFSAQDLPDLSDVTDLNYIFSGCRSFNGDLSQWDVSTIQTFRSAFYRAGHFNGDLSNWNVAAATNMRHMFDRASSFDGDLSSWDVSSVVNMSNMFTESGLSTDNYDRILKGWSALPELEDKVQLDASVEYCEAQAERQSLIDNYGWTINDGGLCEEVLAKDFVIVVDGSTTEINFPSVTTASSFVIDWENNGNWETITTNGTLAHSYTTAPDTIRIRGELNHFEAPKSIIDVVQWGSTHFTSMASSFRRCDKIEKFTATDVPNLSSVTDMNTMFYKATSFNGDLSSWDVSSVTDIRGMFSEASSFNGDISNWDVSSVTDMTSMFRDASSFNGDISLWDVSSVKYLGSMFSEATSFNGDISLWDVSSVAFMPNMFNGATSFNGDISNWDVSSIHFMNGLFTDSGLSTDNYDRILKGWSALPKLEDGVQLDASVEYCESSAERQSLIDNYGWTINDGGLCEEVLAKDFVIVVDGSTTEINFPSVTTASSFAIDWENNGNWETITTNGTISHSYTTPPDTIRIRGELNHFQAPKSIIDVVQWGSTNFSSMNSSFSDCDKIEKFTASDLPDLSSVTDMSYMFYEASSFNGDLSNWDVSSVTDMNFMFSGASSFNGNLSNWDVSSVTNMSNMFSVASSFNGDLSSWDVSSVTLMYFMFNGAKSFNGDLSSWDVSSVIKMPGMFHGATSFNRDLSSWDVSSVTNMSFMFHRATSFNRDLSSWDVSSVTDMSYMFHRATSFNRDLSSWDVSSVTDMSSMFSGADSFDGDLSSWDVSSVVNMSNMFTESGLSTDNYDRILKGWSALPSLKNNVNLDASVEYCEAQAERQSLIDNYGWIINDGGFFCEEDVLAEDFVIVVDGSTTEINFPSVSTASSFAIDWENNGNWETITTNGTISHSYTTAPDTIRIRGELNHFEAPKSIIDVVQWGATNFTSMSSSFYECHKIEKFTASDLPDLSSVTDMSSMFYETLSFNGNLSLWDVSSVTNMSSMFQGATAFNGDLSNWDVSSVTDMNSMFGGATAFNGDLSNWDVSSVTDMNSMFVFLYHFNGDLSLWDVSSVTDMSYMFYLATSFNGDLSSWDVSSVTDMSYMFDRATAFNSDISNWDVSSVTGMSRMFTDSGLSTDNYDRILKGWSALPSLKNNVNLDVSAEYCESFAERQSLVDKFGWTINDGGLCEEVLAEDFVIVVDGSTTEISFPSVSTASSFAIDWENNGNWETITTNGTLAHSYTTAPDTIRIRGELNHFQAPKSIIDVVQWGSTNFTSMVKSFYDCEKLEKFTATDAPDLSSVSDMTQMFAEASSFNSDLSTWDVSSVVKMGSMFAGASSFNCDLRSWNVSSVVTMGRMFYQASSFNCDLSNWDVSSVGYMGWMFHQASLFNCDLSNWDVSKVTSMVNMLTDSGLSTDNYDLLLKGWSELTELKNGVELDVSVEYCESYAERQSLIDRFDWIINDGGLCAEVVAKDFVIVVDGSTTEINFPSVNTASSFDIDWENNGNWETITTNGSISHSYTTAPDTIRIRGELNHFQAPKSIIDVVQWGATNFTSMTNSFYQCDKIEKFTATDVPDLSSVENMPWMFYEASSFNGDLSSWDVSSVVSMAGMFERAASFNGDISNWDVSSVTSMSWMFSEASSFNGDLSLWNVSSVGYMNRMFTESGLSTDNYDLLLKGWSALPALKNGINLYVSVGYCESFAERQSLIDKFGWVINDGGICSEVLAKDFVIVVDGSTTEINFPSVSTASSFAIDWENNGNWETITTNGTLSHSYTATPNTIRIRGELNHFEAPKSIIDVVQWGSTNFTSMAASFKDCAKIEKFTATDVPDLSSVTDLSSMFNGASSFNSDLSTWNASSVTRMDHMFNGASSFNGDISNWDVSLVYLMNSMFQGASSFNGDLSLWNVSSVGYMNDMFIDSGLSTDNYDLILKGWSALPVLTNGVNLGVSVEYCEASAERQSLIDNYGWIINDGGFFCEDDISAEDFVIVVDGSTTEINFPSVSTASSFDIDWENNDNWETITTNGTLSHSYTTTPDTIRIKGDLNHFAAPKSIIDVVQWGSTHFTSMSSSFYECNKIEEFTATDVPDLSSVTDMNTMFRGASSFNGDLSNWDVSSVTNMSLMFVDASSFNGDLSNWDVSSVSIMSWMFQGATSFNSDLSSWDVSSVTDMRSMFYGATSFNSDLSNWDVSSVKGVNMNWMFNRATSFNSDLSNWDVSSITEMSYMFYGATSFNRDLSSWDVSSVTDMSYMFIDSGLLTDNYDLILKGWSALPKLEDGVQLGVSAGYCDAEAERQYLINHYNWIINDLANHCSSANARSILNSETVKGVSGSSISDLAGEIEWKLYDFSGQLIDRGSLTLQNGELFRWQNLQTQYQKAGILRVFDRNGNVSVVKFIRE